MFRFLRIARVSRGKFPQGVQFAKEVAGYINTRYAPVSVQVYTELFGNVGMVHWYSDYESLAIFEKANAQLQADQGYWALLDKGADLYNEGSVHDTLIQSV